MSKIRESISRSLDSISSELDSFPETSDRFVNFVTKEFKKSLEIVSKDTNLIYRALRAKSDFILINVSILGTSKWYGFSTEMLARSNVNVDLALKIEGNIQDLLPDNWSLEDTKYKNVDLSSSRETIVGFRLKRNSE